MNGTSKLTEIGLLDVKDVDGSDSIIIVSNFDNNSVILTGSVSTGSDVALELDKNDAKSLLELLKKAIDQLEVR